MAEAPPTIISLTERFSWAFTLANELHGGHRLTRNFCFATLRYR